MATVREPVKPSANRYEQFVRQELSRAVRRVRFLDLARAGLGLLVATMAYGLVMILLDKWLNLPLGVRQAALALYGTFAIAYGWFVLLRPIRRAVNPYYAAVQVEDRKSTRLNSSHIQKSRMPSSA